MTVKLIFLFLNSDHIEWGMINKEWGMIDKLLSIECGICIAK